MREILIAATIGLLPALAGADILFLDFNMATSEVAAAKAAALKLKPQESVVVLPDISDDERNQISSLNADLYKKWYSGCTQDPCASELGAIKWKLDQERNSLQLTPDSFDKFFAGPGKGKTFETLVMSGHDGTGDFYGMLSGFSLDALKTVAQRHPDFANGVRALYLWGCYTLTSGKAKDLWSAIFPQAQFMAGYDLQSPTSTVPADPKALENLIAMQSSFLTSAPSECRQAPEEVKAADPFDYGVYMKKCGLYLSRQSSGNINKVMTSNCAQAAPAATKWKNAYQCYFEAQAQNCLDVPPDTDKSDLRDAYNFYQVNEECFAQSNDPDAPDTERMVRLIFFKTVMSNLQAHYGQQITQANGALDQLHAPQALRIPDLAKSPPTRHDLIALLRDLRAFVVVAKSQLPNPPPQATADALRQVKTLYKVLNDKLYSLSSCVPFSWVEPDSLEDPEC